MAELKQDPTHPLKHEQCYLCFMTLVEPPPETRHPVRSCAARTRNTWRDSKARGACLARACSRTIRRMKNLDLGYGMFILRAETRAEAEAIASKNPIPKPVCAP